MKAFIYLLLFFTTIFWSVFGQNDSVKNKSVEIVFINGKTYYIHIVSQNETLEQIALAYEVSERDLLLVNRELVMGVHAGQAIKIPVLEGERTGLQVDSFIYHKVKKRQTLYFISKKYKVDIAEIIEYNPAVRDGLSVGDVLKIPRAIETDNVLKNENGLEYIYHIVRKNESLYSIAKQYDVDIEEIQKINKGLIWDVSLGQKIKIPKIVDKLKVNRDTFAESLIYTDENKFNAEYPCKEYTYDNEQFKIAVLLPFQTDRNTIIDTSKLEKGDIKFYKNTARIIEFYEGILLAVDTLRRMGLKIELNVYDTKKSEKTLREILNSEGFSETDLIIGPAYTSNLKIAAEFAKLHEINIVSPFSRSSSLLRFNPWLFQARPNKEVGYENLAQYVAIYYDQNILVYHNGMKNELDETKIFRRKLVDAVSFNKGIETVNYKEIDCSDRNAAGIEATLSVDNDNIIFVPTKNEAFVTELISKLNPLTEKYKILLFGLPEWSGFKNIEQEMFHKFQVHIFDYNYIDYSRYDVKNFVSKFREIYKNEPGNLAFQGYDIARYFLDNLEKSGAQFHNCIPKNPLFPRIKGLGLDIDFQRKDKSGGFLNYAAFILQYTKDYEFVKINTNFRKTYFYQKEWEKEEKKEHNNTKKSDKNTDDETDEGDWTKDW
ncbi:MAG: hypothetical protein CSA05_00010 [Bacteroidia bacterium]|nr:MAG: hypothetical protein CSB01_01375 [Bacteroidia bacterium]PIE86537.1 MAG: hypothetical protein CSA05_00010 [Bacteroidia bacterium]